MGIPETTFIRRKAIFEWLGITRDDLDKLVENKLIHPVILPGKKYRNYITKEILRVFTKGIKYEEMGYQDMGTVTKRRRTGKKK